MPAPYDYASGSGYSRARADWQDFPNTTTPITATQLDKIEQALADIKGTVYNVKDYGATGDGTTNDTTALQACYDAIPAAGGTMWFPPATYVGGFVANDLKAVYVYGHAARLAVPSSTIGVSITTGNSDSERRGVIIDGLHIDGLGGVWFPAGHTSVTGIKAENADFVRLRNVRIASCTTALHFLASGTGWCESWSLETVFISGSTTGIRYQNTGSSGSFANGALRDVGINDCTTGIDATGNTGTGLQRTTFENVVIWLARNSQVGVSIGCNVVGARWQISFESAGVTVTGFNVTTNTANTARANVQVDWQADGSMTKATVGAGLEWTWREGGNYIVTKLGSGTATPNVVAVRNEGDTGDRFAVFGGAAGGIGAGSGTGAFDIALYRNQANLWQTDAQMKIAGGVTTFVKAGAVTDSDFTVDLDGTLAVDNTNSKLYVRIAGTWKSVTLT